ncbi:hypothetical protein BDB01DRAFT_801413 [Pilobolus umbonatus]|nr:hypothetical protein BDB01DRAFT_801413 [Pilobolus umbonatus]
MTVDKTTVDTIKMSELEKENIRLKERLFRSQERLDWMESEVDSLKERIRELHRMLDAEYLSDTESIRFIDSHSLESYEKEER